MGRGEGRRVVVVVVVVVVIVCVLTREPEKDWTFLGG